MKLDKSIILGLILGAIAAVSAHAQASRDPQMPTVNRPTALEEEFHHTYPLNPGGRIELNNINGRVKISSWDRNEVKLDALKYAGTREQLELAEIQIQAEPSLISIRTHYKESNLTFTDDDPIHNPASVEYTLVVPAGARLDAIKLVNGDLDIQNISGDVDARCINGRLRASGLRGHTALSTINGKLELTTDTTSGVVLSEGARPSPRTPIQPTSTGQPTNLPRDIKLKSVNGSVIVVLPSDANAEVTAKTVSGFIKNDFGLPVNDGRYVGHTLAGRLGSGAAHIELKNVNGSISVQRASDGKPLSPATNLLPPNRADMD